MNRMPFLEVAREGKNSFWHYAFSLPFILGAWVFLGSGIAAIFLFLEWSLHPAAPVTLDDNTPLVFSGFMLSFLPWLLATMLAVRIIHQRPIRTLITAFERPRLGRIAQGFGYWLLLIALVSLLEAWLYPGRYRFSFPPEWWRYLFPALILIPIQTSTEEIFFRGYLLQALGLKIRNLPLLILLSALFFALPHLSNPELSQNFWLVMSSYFLTGLVASWITLRDHGLELALGMHAANNLFSLVANYPNSAINIPAIFAIRELDPVYGLVAQIFASLLFLWLAFRGKNNQNESV